MQRSIERNVILLSRLFASIAVLGSLAGSLLMFVVGAMSIVEAYLRWLPSYHPEDSSVPISQLVVISVFEGLDRFLIAIVLLYFGYGVYSLLIRPDAGQRDDTLPAMMRVKQIGQLKQVVAEVIIVILFVLFLKNALRVFQGPKVLLTWEQIATLVALPVCVALLALALNLAQLHPKPERPSEAPRDTLDDIDDAARAGRDGAEHGSTRLTPSETT